ncbi:MFS multidrug transporter [Flagelloscypha sp. PMI_526]|nr:MFS multidrug transporter [Flagelloscypha sp. PMI_526]
MRRRSFWFSFTSILLVTSLWALDLTAIGTIIPAISKDLDTSGDFAWIGTAYALSSTAIRPLIGNLADTMGRKFVILLSLGLFALGSALAGSAQNMAWIISARGVQGLGGGGIATLIDVLAADLVPLNERGLYEGYISLVWAGSSAIGPLVAGSLAERASWRWFFYLNLPICALCSVFIVCFLQVRTPPGNFVSKLAEIDCIGNLLVIAGTTFSTIGLAWAGIRYPWLDIHVSAPLITGFALLIIFLLHQRYIASRPTIPWDIFSSKTAVSAFLTAFAHGITSISFLYYIPIYFQAVLGASLIKSGLYTLPTALLIAPMALINGIIVQRTQRYIPGNCFGWVLSIIGFAVLSLLTPESTAGQWIGYQMIVAAAIGVLYNATIFPALASLPIEQTARIVAFQSFVISFAQTWGLTISASILQNRLLKTLPSSFILDYLSGEADVAVALIQQIPSLPDPIKGEVKGAFASSMSTIWRAMAIVSIIGFLFLALMREVPMRANTDPKYSLEIDNAPSVFEVKLPGLARQQSTSSERSIDFDDRQPLKFSSFVNSS